jgi:integrase
MLTDLLCEKVKPADKLVDYHDEKMRGLLLSVSPGGRKAWRAMYYINGASQSFTIGRYPLMSLKDARERARVFLGNPQAELAAANAHKMAEDFDAVADEYLKRSVAKAGLISGPEIARILRVYVRPSWGKRKLVDLRRSDVTHLLDKVEDENGPAMADGVLSVIRQVMGFYERRHDSFTSPIIRGMGRTSATARARSRILTDDELKAVWEAAGQAGMFGAIVKLCLLSGQRRSKVAEMRWNDVDDAGVWTIDVQARQKGTGGTLKLPECAHAIICAQPEVVGVDYVFPAGKLGKGQKEIKAFSAWSQYKEELDKASGVTGWVIHDLRRTARSLLSRAGVLPHISERVLGHVQPGVQGVYDRFEYRDEIADALARLASLIQNIVNPPTGNVIPLRPEAA